MKNDIVIINGDKGGVVVILNVKDYVEECGRQLKSIENHEHLQKDPIAANNELIHNSINRFENEKLIAEGIKTDSPQAPNFLHSLRHTRRKIQVDQL